MKAKRRTLMALVLLCLVTFPGTVGMLLTKPAAARELPGSEMQEVIGGYLCDCESCNDPISTCWCHYCGHGNTCGMPDCPICPCDCTGPDRCSTNDCCVVADGTCAWCPNGTPPNCHTNDCDDCCAAAYDGPCEYCSKSGTIDCGGNTDDCQNGGGPDNHCPADHCACTGTICREPGGSYPCDGQRGPCDCGCGYDGSVVGTPHCVDRIHCPVCQGCGDNPCECYIPSTMSCHSFEMWCFYHGPTYCGWGACDNECGVEFVCFCLGVNCTCSNNDYCNCPGGPSSY